VNTSNPAASGKEPFTVVFKSGVKTSVPVSGRDTVKLWISYKVGTDAKLALRNIRVQDAGCHCPARIDRLSDRWLTFACHHLGGLDILSSTTTITQAHHGDWYRFGAATASLLNVPATSTGTITNWTNTPHIDYPFQSGSADWIAANDPCPAGWRLPDIDELAGAVNFSRPNNSSTSFNDVNPVNNTFAWSGTWSNSASNFSALLKVGDYLYLPAAGYRYYSDGSLYYRGSYGYYWSSSAQSSNGWYAHFNSGSRGVGSTNRAEGFSVRCVAAE
jgi:uncharacterized protein (TIGR02145 family)